MASLNNLVLKEMLLPDTLYLETYFCENAKNVMFYHELNGNT